jgi:ectoine hydroxylase-related dioxygenase (phytanoyl-CoA dioxygenase family)
MRGILAIRLHLDESRMDNGPLRVIAGSHTEGRFPTEQIRRWDEEKAVTCAVAKGGALLVRPLCFRHHQHVPSTSLVE